MFPLIVSFLMLSQISEFDYCISKDKISFAEFRKTKVDEGFTIEEPNNRVQIFLSNESYPFSLKYELSQPVKFRRIIENDIVLEMSVYYDKKSDNVKYYEMRIDRKKPDINDVVNKYRSQESDVHKLAKLAVAEMESYRLSVFETEYLVREIETLLVDHAGTPNHVTSESKSWKTKNGVIEFSTEQNQLKLERYWE